MPCVPCLYTPFAKEPLRPTVGLLCLCQGLWIRTRKVLCCPRAGTRRRTFCTQRYSKEAAAAAAAAQYPAPRTPHALSPAPSNVRHGSGTSRNAKRNKLPRPGSDPTRDHTAIAAVSDSTCIYIPTRHPSEWPSPDSPGRCHIRPHPHMRVGRRLGRRARACLTSGGSGLPCLGAWGPRDGPRFPLPFCVAFLNNNRNFWASSPSVGTPDLAPCLVSPACIPLVRKSY